MRVARRQVHGNRAPQRHAGHVGTLDTDGMEEGGDPRQGRGHRPAGWRGTTRAADPSSSRRTAQADLAPM